MLDQPLKVFVEVMLTPGFPLKLGMMIAIALMMGFWLYEDSKDFVKWFITGFVYVGFQEWFRDTVANPTVKDQYLAFVASFVFGVSIYIGARLAKRARTSRRLEGLGIDTQRIKDIMRTLEEENGQDKGPDKEQ